MNEKFIEWSNNIFTGAEGGNPDSDIWFSGIEPGGSIWKTCKGEKPTLNRIIKIFNEYKVDDKNHCSWTDKFQKDYPDFSTWPFLQKIAKVMLSFENRNIKNYKLYIKNELLRENGNHLLLNLYPINFRSTDKKLWEEEHVNITGANTKDEYLACLRSNRFKKFGLMLESVQPKVIVCSGKSFASEFLHAYIFSRKDNVKKYKVEKLDSSLEIEIYHCVKKHTLIIIPFLGRGGIVSDNDLKCLGEIIRKEHSRLYRL